MNNQQLKYAKERIEAIYRKKNRDIYDKYPDNRLSNQEIWEKLRSGDFLLKEKPPESHQGSSLRNYLVFLGEELGAELREKALKELDDEKRKMLDKLILGDAQDALDMLNEFAKKDF